MLRRRGIVLPLLLVAAACDDRVVRPECVTIPELEGFTIGMARRDVLAIGVSESEVHPGDLIKYFDEGSRLEGVRTKFDSSGLYQASAYRSFEQDSTALFDLLARSLREEMVARLGPPDREGLVRKHMYGGERELGVAVWYRQCGTVVAVWNTPDDVKAVREGKLRVGEPGVIVSVFRPDKADEWLAPLDPQWSTTPR